nr:transposase [Escherichia coli]
MEIDNNIAENALRGVAVGRKNWMFAGSDSGGEHAAVLSVMAGWKSTTTSQRTPYGEWP